MIELISAGIGAGLSLWGESERARAEREEEERRKKLLEEAKITPREQASLIADVNRSYNAGDMSNINRSAYGLGGVLNADTLRGIYAGRSLGQRASDIAKLKSETLRWNKNIDVQQSTIPSARPVNLGNVVMGGLAGLEIGESLEGLFKDPDLEAIEKVSSSELTQREIPEIEGLFDFGPAKSPSLRASPLAGQGIDNPLLNLFKKR